MQSYLVVLNEPQKGVDSVDYYICTFLLCVRPCGSLIRTRHLAACESKLPPPLNLLFLWDSIAVTVIMPVYVLLESVQSCLLDVWLVRSDQTNN